MKKYFIALHVLLLAVLVQVTSNGQESVKDISYVEKIQQTAETMKVFPIDLIAREGPLSYFEKGSWIPGVSIRNELNSESFRQF